MALSKRFQEVAYLIIKEINDLVHRNQLSPKSKPYVHFERILTYHGREGSNVLIWLQFL